jgi:WD40 repeat protein
MRRFGLLCMILSFGTVASAAEPKLVATLKGHDKSVRGIAFYPDGKTLATASSDGTVRLWDVTTGKERETLIKQKYGYRTLSLSQNGSTLAASDNAGEIQLWLKGAKKPTILEVDRPTEPLVVSPNGKILVIGADLWDVATRKKITTLDGCQPRRCCLAFSPDGKRIAALGTLSLPVRDFKAGETVVGVWDIHGKLHTTVVLEDVQRISSLAFFPNGRSLAVSGSDLKNTAVVGVWDIHTGRCERLPLDSTKRNVSPVAISPNGRLLAGGNLDGIVTLWDMHTHKEYCILRGNDTDYDCLTFSPDGRWLAVSGSDPENINIYELPQDVRTSPPMPLFNWLSTDGSLRSLALRRNGKELAVGGNNGTVTVWELGKDEPRLTFQAHKKAILALAYSPDGKTLLSAGLDGTPRLWEASTGKQRAELTWHTAPVLCAAFTPDGETIATGSSDGTVRLWDADGKGRRTLTGHEGAVRCLAFVADGKYLLTGGSDGTFKQWKVATEENPTELLKTDRSIAALARTRDGRAVFVANGNGTVTYLDLTTGKSRRILDRSVEMLQGLAVSPDGRTLAVCGRLDSQVRRYDVATGKELSKLDWHTAEVSAVAYSADGNILFTAGMDGAVRLWRATADK